MRPIITLALAASLLVGCQTQTEKQSPTSIILPPAAAPVRAQQQQPTPPVGKGLAFDTDDCAARMQTLEGQLMLYYFKHQKLPIELDELRAVADPGEDVPTTCPVSHLPYTYNPAGLVFGDDMRRLIAYDSSPAHGGTRWGVLFSQAKGREPVNMQVIQIPEPSMVGYHPAPPMAANAPTSAAAPDEIPPDIRERMEEQLRQKRLEQLRLQRQQQNPDAAQQQPGQQPIQQQPVQPQPGGGPQQ